jgi:hypothetical protein
VADARAGEASVNAGDSGSQGSAGNHNEKGNDMTKGQQRQLDRLRRIKKYVTDHAIEPPIARATALFAQANTVSTAMEARGGLQVEGRGGFLGGAAENRALSKELRQILQAIAATARGLNATEFPGVAEQFRMDPMSRSYQALRDTAHGFLTQIAPIKAVFTERGFAADFDTDLEAKLTAFTAATSRKFGGRQTRKLGTAGMKELTQEAIDIMGELNPLMRNYLERTNVELLAVWRAAARAYSPPRRKATGEEPPGSGDGGGDGDTGSGSGI